jgi:hypothetical protein
MHREGHHLNLSVQGNFGSGISGGFILSDPVSSLHVVPTMPGETSRNLVLS